MKPTANPRKIYVGDLLANVRREELETEFSPFGRIKDIWIAQNPPGFAFVEYEEEKDAEKAVRDLDGKTVCGTRVRVEISKPPDEVGKGSKGAPSRRPRGRRPAGRPSAPVRPVGSRDGRGPPSPPPRRRSPPRRGASPPGRRRAPSPPPLMGLSARRRSFSPPPLPGSHRDLANRERDLFERYKEAYLRDRALLQMAHRVPESRGLPGLDRKCVV